MREALTSSHTAPPRPPAGRLEYVDGLRAVSAIWVAVHHAVVTTIPEATLATPVIGPVVGSLFFGQFPVMIFLALSGFCLYFPCVRKNPESPGMPSTFFAYMRRRAMRIAPPYFFAALFCIGLALFPALQVGVWKDTGPIDSGVILSHVLFIHNLIPAHSSKIDYPMWSIGLEWQLYLLFPLMVWGFRRSNGVVTTLAALAVAIVIRATYRQIPGPLSPALRDGPFAYLMIFGLGMLAARYTVLRKRLAPNWLIGAALVGGLATIRAGSGNGLVHDLAAGAVAFATLLLAVDPNHRLSRVLRTRWLVFIGVFSYSLYLMHAPLLHLAWFALRPLALAPDLECLLLVLSIAPIVVACYAFHCFFERPFMRVGAPRVVAAQPEPAGGSPSL